MAEYYNRVNVGSDGFRIDCNGVKTAVGANLYMALHRLRREESTRVVWADAICINQSDVHERNQQIAAMGDIFRNAYSVLVWLGADEDTNRVFDAVARASSGAFAGVCSVVSTWTASTEQIILAEQPQYRIQGSTKGFSEEGPLSAESMTWLKVLKLYLRRWFRRLWVVQEIALARRATVIWGGCEISWQWIGLAAAIIRTNWNRIVPGWSAMFRRDYTSCLFESRRLVLVGVMNAYFMYRISSFQNYFKPVCFSFCELLTLTRQFSCVDERDKIFGLLGLTTTDHVNSSITPDYTKPLADVYRNVASAMIRSTVSLASLFYVHHAGIHDRDSPIRSSSYLPSWIPKWNIVGPRTLTPLDAHPNFGTGLPQPAQFRGPDETGDPDRLVVRANGTPQE